MTKEFYSERFRIYSELENASSAIAREATIYLFQTQKTGNSATGQEALLDQVAALQALEMRHPLYISEPLRDQLSCLRVAAIDLTRGRSGDRSTVDQCIESVQETIRADLRLNHLLTAQQSLIR